MNGESITDTRIEETLARLNDAVGQLSAGDLEAERARRLVEECSELASQAAAMLSERASLPAVASTGPAAGAQSRLDGHRQDPLL